MATAKRDLVVLLHGFLGGRFQLLPLAASLTMKFDIFNYGYRSRAETLEQHARSLVDSVKHRMESKQPRRVHFVCHSFGGVVLRSAFGCGLEDAIPGLPMTRAVLIGSPLRGASFARSFQEANIKAPDAVKQVLHYTAKTVLGGGSGMQLLTQDAAWFEKGCSAGSFPDDVTVLVVAGSLGAVNPLVEGSSDGVVGVAETMLARPHYRKEYRLPHNTLLFSPGVIRDVSRFLTGEAVGELVEGEAL